VEVLRSFPPHPVRFIRFSELAEFCERWFLKLWSYPNPYKDDRHELCDLLAVFGDTVFIFFARENG
jgi:hypothetical protein